MRVLVGIVCGPDCLRFGGGTSGLPYLSLMFTGCFQDVLGWILNRYELGMSILLTIWVQTGCWNTQVGELLSVVWVLSTAPKPVRVHAQDACGGGMVGDITNVASGRRNEVQVDFVRHYVVWSSSPMTGKFQYMLKEGFLSGSDRMHGNSLTLSAMHSRRFCSRLSSWLGSSTWYMARSVLSWTKVAMVWEFRIVCLMMLQMACGLQDGKSPIVLGCS